MLIVDCIMGNFSSAPSKIFSLVRLPSLANWSTFFILLLIVLKCSKNTVKQDNFLVINVSLIKVTSNSKHFDMKLQQKEARRTSCFEEN